MKNTEQPLARIMAFILYFLIFLTGVVCAGETAGTTPTMLYFYSHDCDECARVKAEFLPGFLETYESRINFEQLEVTAPGVMDSLLSLESRVHVPEADKLYPAVYFQGRMFEGEVQVRLQLPAYVDYCLANPDSAWALHETVMARTPEITQTTVVGDEKTVAIAYFSKAGCSQCARAEEIIEWLTAHYPYVTVDEFNIAEEQSSLLSTALGMRTGVPEDRMMSTPMMFIGGQAYLLAEDISREKLAQAVEWYGRTGAAAIWNDIDDNELARASSRILDIFNGFTVVAVALAGLGDGVNPCAFATIIFFVSYLGMIGRRRNEILLVGISFAFSVFLTYFLVGLGFYGIVERMSNFEYVARIIFGVTGVVCIVFGILSVRDYFLARRGNASDMALQLPTFLKNRIHAAIRNRVRMKSFIVGALAIGFLVSVLELACTGQVYLPTIALMVGKDGMAIPYLLLYNICFITPLLFVFGIVYFGVSSRAIASVMESRVGAVKLGLAMVFFLLGGLLIWTVM